MNTRGALCPTPLSHSFSNHLSAYPFYVTTKRCTNSYCSVVHNSLYPIPFLRWGIEAFFIFSRWFTSTPKADGKRFVIWIPHTPTAPLTSAHTNSLSLVSSHTSPTLKGTALYRAENITELCVNCRRVLEISSKHLQRTLRVHFSSSCLGKQSRWGVELKNLQLKKNTIRTFAFVRMRFDAIINNSWPRTVRSI